MNILDPIIHRLIDPNILLLLQEKKVSSSNINDNTLPLKTLSYDSKNKIFIPKEINTTVESSNDTCCMVKDTVAAKNKDENIESKVSAARSRFLLRRQYDKNIT